MWLQNVSWLQEKKNTEASDGILGGTKTSPSSTELEMNDSGVAA